MTKAKNADRPFARLRFDDGEVVVAPQDQDIFLVSAEKASEACRQEVPRSERIGRFRADLLVPLHNWCVERADRIRACFIPLPGRQLHVFVITTVIAFDFALAHEIAELERLLARKGWRIGVSQLPAADDASLATFFDPTGALQVYAQRRPASQKSGAPRSRQRT